MHHHRNLDPTVHQVIIKLVKYAKSLEEIIAQRNRELKRAEQINLMHIYSEQKRDEIISQLVKEIKQLKEKSSSQSQQETPIRRENTQNQSFAEKMKKLQIENSPSTRSISPKRPLSVASFDSSKLVRSNSASRASTRSTLARFSPSSKKDLFLNFLLLTRLPNSTDSSKAIFAEKKSLNDNGRPREKSWK